MEALRMRHARAEAPETWSSGRRSGPGSPLDGAALSRLGAACPGGRLVEVARLAVQAHIALAAGVAHEHGDEPEDAQ